VGDRVLIVGSTPELGGWKVGGGLTCTTTESTFPFWTSEDVSIRAGEVEFKVVVMKVCGSEARWEDGDNKKLMVDAASARTSTVLCEYGRTGATVVASTAADPEWDQCAAGLGLDLTRWLLLAQMVGLQAPQGELLLPLARQPAKARLRRKSRLARPRQGRRGAERSGRSQEEEVADRPGSRSSCPAPPRRSRQSLPAGADPSWSTREAGGAPPSSTSWDWPLSRVEKKARVDMIDRSMLRADCRALAEKLRRSRAADRAAP